MKKLLVGLLVAASLVFAPIVSADVGDKVSYRQFTVETYAASPDQDYACIYYGSHSANKQMENWAMRTGEVMYWARTNTLDAKSGTPMYMGIMQRGMFSFMIGIKTLDQLSVWYTGLKDFTEEMKSKVTYIWGGSAYWFTHDFYHFWNENYEEEFGMRFQEQRPHVMGFGVAFEEELPEVLNSWLYEIARRDQTDGRN